MSLEIAMETPRRQTSVQRAFAALGAVLAAALPALAGDRGLVDTSESAHATMYMADLADAKWTGGMWGDRFDVCSKTMIPHMWDIFQSDKDSHAWANFRIAARLDTAPGAKHVGPPFADGDFFKWFEGVAQVYAITRDPELDRLMDGIIEVIAKAQRGDGYFGTGTVIPMREGVAVDTALADREHFETYNMGHLMTAACVHDRATGKTTMLAVARKAADYLCNFYQKSSPQLARSAICPSHYMGIIELYRTTHDPRYLELGRQLIEIRSEVEDGTDQNQDRVAFRMMTKAVGHAVRANYLFAGAADVEVETGDRSLLDTLRTLDDDVVDHKLYITGATGALYDGASPDGSADHASIQLVHQAYGRDYQLPNLSAYNESCATIGFALWNWRMFLATGEARYSDVFEQTLYNGVLAAISLSGTDYFYVNPLKKLDAMSWPLRWSRTRQPNIQLSFCCPPNVVRTIAEAQDYIYTLSKDTLWVNLYGASTLDTRWVGGDRIRLRQETDYPWAGKIRIVVAEAPGHPVALRLRIPGWVRDGGVSVAVNGQPADGTPRSGSYFEIRRTWAANDVVELNLPFGASIWESNPLVEETLNQVAVRYGPLVYCLESGDLPAGVRIEDVALSSEVSRDAFEPKMERISGADVMTLTVPALQIARTEGSAKALYAVSDPAPPRAISVKLVPYYAWGNRGDSEMTVWIPVR
jgi:hypothetical protein